MVGVGAAMAACCASGCHLEDDRAPDGEAATLIPF